MVVFWYTYIIFTFFIAKQFRYICEGCDQPNLGLRFKCSICYSFYLCPVCNGKGIHSQHAIEKIGTEDDEEDTQSTHHSSDEIHDIPLPSSDDLIPLRFGRQFIHIKCPMQVTIILFLLLADGSTGKDTPKLLTQCFNALFHILLDNSVRNVVALELNSKALLSNEAKEEATRIAGDPIHKTLVIMDSLYVQCRGSQKKLLDIARALSQIEAVNNVGLGMETVFWRYVLCGPSGNNNIYCSSY